MARRRSRFVRPAPRTKMWIGAGIGQTTLSPTSVTLLSVLGTGQKLLRPFTILRTHMLINIRSDQQVAVEFTFGSWGELIVTDTAAAIGITAIPDPSAFTGGNPEADWFSWAAFVNGFFIDINGTDGIGVDGSFGSNYVIDSKAMRKVGPDDDLVEVASVASSNGTIITTQGRRLIQLH